MATRTSGFSIVALVIVALFVGVSIYTGIIYFAQDGNASGVMFDSNRAAEVGSEAIEESQDALHKAFDGAADSLHDHAEHDNS